ncbi:hypothetical protein Ndes2526B_g04015 [Nannochloris sp. 'desiccata']|nr:hypothetical protein NADE_009247 [Chlorella desiccata (nom. nud.)]
MPSATVIGAVLGFGVQIYANAVRKLPLMQGPWQHAIAAGAGAAFGSWLVDFEARTEKDLQVLMEKRAEAERKHQNNLAEARS